MALISTKRSVLLVEDDPSMRDPLCRYMAGLKFEVMTAIDLDSARKHLRERAPSLVILDLTLPRGSGYELCEFIRDDQRLAHIPILVMSDRGTPEAMAHAEEVGANAFLRKPFTKDKFEKYVSSLMDGPNSSRPSFRRLRPTDPPPPPPPPPSSQSGK
jgi:DNA-binding response OmpR family regulator